MCISLEQPMDGVLAQSHRKGKRVTTVRALTTSLTDATFDEEVGSATEPRPGRLLGGVVRPVQVDRAGAG